MSYDAKDIIIGAAVIGAVGYGGYVLMNPKKPAAGAAPAGKTPGAGMAPQSQTQTQQQTQPPANTPAAPNLAFNPAGIPGWPTAALANWAISDAQAAGAGKGVMDGTKDGLAKAAQGTSANPMAPTGLSADVTNAYINTYNQAYLSAYTTASTSGTPDPSIASLYAAALTALGTPAATSGMGYHSSGYVGYGHTGYGHTGAWAPEPGTPWAGQPRGFPNAVPGSGWGSWRHFAEHGRAAGLYPPATRGTSPVAIAPSRRGSAPVAYDANYGYGNPAYQGRHAGQSVNQAGQVHPNVSGPFHGDNNVHHGYYYR
jgi:hypothetical protein